MPFTRTFASASIEVATSALTAASPPTMWTNWAPFDVTQLPMKLPADAESDAPSVNKIAALTVRASAAAARGSGWLSPPTRMMSLEHRSGCDGGRCGVTVGTCKANRRVERLGLNSGQCDCEHRRAGRCGSYRSDDLRLCSQSATSEGCSPLVSMPGAQKLRASAVHVAALEGGGGGGCTLLLTRNAATGGVPCQSIDVLIATIWSTN
jgi:hypothetical protein